MAYAPKSTMNVAYKNNYLYDELAKYGKLKDNTEYSRSLESQGGFRRKAKSDEKLAEEKSERRYVRRSNICGECYQAKAVGTGECGC